MRTVEVCLSPQLLPLYNLENKLVVVVDILRATSCMTTAIAHGVKEIIPVASVEDCRDLQQKGFLAAAERDGIKIEGFDLDNSPFSYMHQSLEGKIIAVTTTNGTQVITQSKHAAQLVVGSFLNEKALLDYILNQSLDIVIACAGWKGKSNLEDSLFAGSLVYSLKRYCTIDCDAACMVEQMYHSVKDNKLSFLEKSSHVNRLKKLNIRKDIEFCLQVGLYDVVPVLSKGDKIVNSSHLLFLKESSPLMK